jgi:predicted nucleic acid-binding protein
MTRFLLDTDVLIDFSNGHEPGLSFVRRAVDDGDELGVTAVNLAEFWAGLTEPQRAAWEEFFEPLEYWTISPAAAKQAGRWRYDFARRGRPLPTTDTLIASVAQEQQAVIVTKNGRDFPMPGVRLLTLFR